MKHALIVIAFVAAFLYLTRNAVPGDPYTYDEADYMFAASLGWFANFADTPSQPIVDFIRTGLSRGKDAAQRNALSQAVRDSNDVVFYRHWHGPLYYYWLHTISGDEGTVRRLGLMFPILTGAAIYFGALWVSASETAAILSLALFLFSRATLGTVEIAPHALFALCVVTALVFLMKGVQTGRECWWYFAAIAAGFAFAAMEVAIVLVLTLAICAFIERRRSLLKMAALFVGTVLVVWPAAILKLSFVKAYFFMAYLALFRKSPWGNTTLLETWWLRFIGSPVEWAMIALALVLYIRNRHSERQRWLYPPLLFAGLMVLAILRVNTSTPRYALMFQPALDRFAGLTLGVTLASYPGRMRAFMTALFCAALLIPAYARSGLSPRPENRNHMLIVYVRDHGLATKTILLPQVDLPMIHYYFPHAHLLGYAEDTPPGEDIQSADAVFDPGQSQPRAK